MTRLSVLFASAAVAMVFGGYALPVEADTEGVSTASVESALLPDAGQVTSASIPDPSPAAAEVAAPKSSIPAVNVDPGAAVAQAADAAKAHSWGALVVALAGVLAFVLAFIGHRMKLSDTTTKVLSVVISAAVAIASNTALGAMTDLSSVLLYALGPIVAAVTGALSPKPSAALLAVLLVCFAWAGTGCALLTPAIKSGNQTYSCQLENYWKLDPQLSAPDRTERLAATAQYRTLSGLPAVCPEVGR